MAVSERAEIQYAASLNPGTFSKLQYRVDATRRAYQRSLQALKQLEAEAAATPPPPPPAELLLLPSPPTSFQTTLPQIGFVLPTPSATPPEPSAAPFNPGPLPQGLH